MFERALQIYSEVRDDNHPWAMNTAAWYFAALSESGRIPEAIDFLGDRLARSTHFNDCMWWMTTTIRTILQLIDAQDAVRFRSLLTPIDRLAAASPEEAWTGSLETRAAQKSAGALGEQGAKGFLVSGILAWILAVLAATLRDLITRDEADAHLRLLEDRLAAIFGEPTPFLFSPLPPEFCWPANANGA